MFKKFSTKLAVCALLLTSSGAFASNISGTETVTDNYATMTWNWSPSGTTVIRWNIYVTKDDFLVVCGAYATQGGGSSTLKFSRKSLRVSRIRRDGASLIRNLDFFARVPNQHLASELKGQQANCVTTTTKDDMPDANFEMTSDKSSFR